MTEQKKGSALPPALPVKDNDEYFGLQDGVTKRQNAAAFKAYALKDLSADAVKWDGDTVGEQMNLSRKLANYAALRAYTGNAARVVITASGIAGRFSRRLRLESDIDTRGTTILTDDGIYAWDRQYGGAVDVQWFEPTTGGHSEVFSLAAKAAPGAINLTGYQSQGTMPRALKCDVRVPAGTYTLTEMVDTGNKDVTWLLDPAAIIIGDQYINGECRRAGNRSTRQGYGTSDYACGLSITVNSAESDAVAAVTGLANPSELSGYADRDSVGLFVRIGSVPATLSASTATYTALTAVIPPPSADVVKRLRRGMLIDTNHAVKWTGALDSWNADGSVLTVKGGWYLQGGGGAASTPTDGTGFLLNAFTKNWAYNGSVTLNTTGTCKGSAGFELSVYNSRGDSSTDLNVTENRVWGFDAASLSSKKGQSGFITRGPWVYGHTAWLSDTGFYYRGDGKAFLGEDSAGRQQLVLYNSGSMEIGSKDVTDGVPRFLDFNTSGLGNDYDSRLEFSGGGAGNGKGIAFIRAASLEVTGTITADTNMQLGTTSVAASRFIDFNTGGQPVDYDSRLLATGGSATAGQGTLTAQVAEFAMGGNLAPTSDSTKLLGKVAAKWLAVNAVSALFSGPVRIGQYTIATMPAASAWTGYNINVTDASGGSKWCQSNGTTWNILNTNTPVA